MTQSSGITFYCKAGFLRLGLDTDIRVVFEYKSTNRPISTYLRNKVSTASALHANKVCTSVGCYINIIYAHRLKLKRISSNKIDIDTDKKIKKTCHIFEKTRTLQIFEIPRYTKIQ